MTRRSSRHRSHVLACVVAVLAVPTMLAVSMPAVLAVAQRAPGPTTTGWRQLDPVARLQVVLKKVHIYSDRDWGKGEMDLHTFIERCDPEAGCGADSVGLARSLLTFSANDGADLAFDRVVPGVADRILSETVSEEGGIGVEAGQRYRLIFDMREQDPVIDDNMGAIIVTLEGEHGWRIGTHEMRSVVDEGRAGDYRLEFEIRRMLLPDLEPLSMLVIEGGSAEDEVCVKVLNRGAREAGPFQVALLVDGALPPIGTVEWFGLGPAQLTDPCIHARLPTSGQYYLTALIDEPRVVFEENEANNRFAQPYIAPRI